MHPHRNRGQDSSRAARGSLGRERLAGDRVLPLHCDWIVSQTKIRYGGCRHEGKPPRNRSQTEQQVRGPSIWTSDNAALAELLFRLLRPLGGASDGWCVGVWSM